MPDVQPSPTLPDWPTFGWADDVRPALANMVSAGGSGVLATLYAVVGGSPRPAGSQMLFAEAQAYGFLSGGCIEGDLALHAAKVLRTGEPQRLIYGDGGPFADIRLVCGGRVDILLERLACDDLAVHELLQARAARRSVLWASNGVERACLAEGSRSSNPSASLSLALDAIAAAPDAVCAEVGEGLALALRYEPQSRLVVVGHDPTALAIASLGAQSGFETHLVRPKGPAEPPPLPDVIYHRAAADEALAEIGLDRWTYVAVATHALEVDESVLAAALPSHAAYVGVLGARRRLPERLARLRAGGLAPETVARLHAPIGLDIGGKAPFEIAVSVLAEVMAQAAHTRPATHITVQPRAAAA